MDTGFLYDGVQMIAEYDGSTLGKRYIPGILPDEVLIKIESSTKTYFHKDRLGSVLAVTDASGDVLSSMKYGPFGETPSLTGTPFGYTGQRFDSELGAYYYKARYCSPAIGRFLQPDPIGFDAGDMNLYAYVGNDAVNLTDPAGLVGEKLLKNLWNALDDAWDWLDEATRPQSAEAAPLKRGTPKRPTVPPPPVIGPGDMPTSMPAPPLFGTDDINYWTWPIEMPPPYSLMPDGNPAGSVVGPPAPMPNMSGPPPSDWLRNMPTSRQYGEAANWNGADSVPRNIRPGIINRKN